MFCFIYLFKSQFHVNKLGPCFIHLLHPPIRQLKFGTAIRQNTQRGGGGEREEDVREDVEGEEAGDEKEGGGGEEREEKGEDEGHGEEGAEEKDCSA